MSAEHYRKTIDDYLRMMSAGDWRGVANLFAADATVEDPVGSEPVRGIDAVAAFYRGNMEGNPLRLQLEGPVRAAGREAVFPFSVHLSYEGRPTRIDIIDIFSFDDAGKIAAMRAYFGPDNFVAAA